MGAVAAWGLWGVASKLAADRIPPLPNQVLASLGLLIPAAFVVPALRRDGCSWRGLGLAFGAGLLGATGSLAFLASFTAGGKTAVVAPLTALYPLITVIAAVGLMRERMHATQVVGLALSIVAVVLLSLEPGSGLSVTRIEFRISDWLGLALGALVAFGSSAILQKLATNHVSGDAAFGAFSAAFIPVAVGIYAFTTWPRNLAAVPTALGVAGGVLNGLGVLATLAAYRSGGKASLVTPLAALYPVITVVVAVVFLGERLDSRQAAGIALAIAGGVCLGREEGPGGRQASDSPLPAR